MRCEDLVHESYALRRGQVRQSNQPCLLAALQEDEAAEVLVQRNEDSFVCGGPGEEDSISGIRPELPGLEHIVPTIPQPFSKAATRAVVDQESHAG